MGFMKMLKHLLMLQELSLELASDMGTYQRLVDSKCATEEHESEEISTESSSPFLRAIGLDRGIKLDKFTMIGHLDELAYTVAKDMYRKEAHFYSMLTQIVEYFKNNLIKLKRDVKSEYVATYLPDMYSQQTMVVANRLLGKEDFYRAAYKFSDLFEALTVTYARHVNESARSDLHSPDPGYKVTLVKNVKAVNHVLNNTIVSYKPKKDVLEWRSVTHRSRINNKHPIELTSKDMRVIYNLMTHCVELLEKSIAHDYYNYRSGNNDRPTYNTVSKMYLDLYATMIRIVFLLNEMYSHFMKELEDSHV